MKGILIIAILSMLIMGCGSAPPKNYLVTKADMAINVTNCMDGVDVVYTTLKKNNCITPGDSLSEHCQVLFYKDVQGLKMKVTREE